MFSFNCFSAREISTLIWSKSRRDGRTSSIACCSYLDRLDVGSLWSTSRESYCSDTSSSFERSSAVFEGRCEEQRPSDRVRSTQTRPTDSLHGVYPVVYSVRWFLVAQRSPARLRIRSLVDTGEWSQDCHAHRLVPTVWSYLQSWSESVEDDQIKLLCTHPSSPSLFST